MSPRAGRRFGLGCVFATLSLEAVMVGLAPTNSDIDLSAASVATLAVALPTFLLLAAIGALILARLPGHRVGVVFAVAPVLLMLANVLEAYFYSAQALGLPNRALVAALLSPSWVVGVGGMAIFLPLCFPTGEYLSPPWRWVGRAGVVSLTGVWLSWSLDEGPVNDYPEVSNPVGIPGLHSVLEVVVAVGFFVFVSMLVLSFLSLVIRFRRSHGVERQQLKWFVVSTVAALSFFVVIGPLVELAGVTTPDALYLALMALVPISVGVAILRHRLYDIDRIINRTLVYGLLTALLALTYFGFVVGLQAALQPVSGNSKLAIALTTLIVAALFLPARRRLQSAVDRRFNRRTYDATRTIEAFNARLRQEIDLDSLRYELLAVVDETMQPAGVSLWLRTPEAGR
jgi:hypothetical protein